MRNPNGYGTVYKLSGKRRRPWVAASNTKYSLVDGKAKRTRTILGYYATKKEAQIALAEYNVNPYDADCTFKKLFDEWFKTKDLSSASVSVYNKAFERFSSLHDRKLDSITLHDLEAVMDSTEVSDVSRHRMKQLLNQMYGYAERYDMVKTNLAKRINVSAPETKIERKPFSDEEIKVLWESDSEEAKATLIMIYTGVRVGELYSMEIDKDEWLLKGGSKTKAGKNRIVPIREKIKPLMDIDRSMPKKSFYNNILKALKPMNHTPHDCRVTFATRYKNADPTAIKLIMGHEITDITKGVYTKYTPNELRNIIESVDF